ncbi:MAG: hypothetical protein QOE70_4473 [Chthoniobacter sp.]|jgi:glycosyltransferase involved in cell wall biosynthesis/predicted O-methyltransferase YrrM|nr:hypothetical protein [Chthoniobacter sp.]
MDSPDRHSSHLNTLIPGEIKNDSFSALLRSLVMRPDVHSILEIGSSAGEGSTEALISGLKEKTARTELYCLEISSPRFAKLQATYGTLDFFHCYKCSSVCSSEFPTPEALSASLESAPGSDVYPKTVVLAWLNADIEYLKQQGLDANGISLIKVQHGINTFDLVLIDGGDFTGEADLRHVHGAKYIALNDIHSYKNASNHLRLKADPNYALVAEDHSYRNGYSVFTRNDTPQCPSVLDVIIPGEITRDPFYDKLRALATLPDVATILEIGSSAGAGSTEAFVSGIRERPSRADLYCMEVSATRFTQLRATYQAFDFVHCYNVSSVPLSDFPTHETVSTFCDTVPSALRAYPKSVVLGWLDADLEYVRSHGLDLNGIELIKAEQKIGAFDLVLIDGSEFTGEAELRHVYGARLIALDDINAYKNWHNHLRLSTDPNYEVIAEDRSVRNGFSVFRRIDKPEKASVLDVIIPGEIKNDAFYDALRELAMLPDVASILEIGSSAGGGSTAAFVSGLKERSTKADLFCMEVSAARFSQLQATYQDFAFVHCYNVSSVPVSEFASYETVGTFCDSVQSALRAYPKATVLGWLDADLDYVRSHGCDLNGIQLIKAERGIDAFDLVLIDGSEFTGEAELRHVYGSRYIALDDINAFKNWTNYFQLKDDPNYELISENRSVRNGFCVFKRVELQRELPVHFFTIVLNGMPFIRYHIDILRALPFDWHWHIVEGVADLKHDTAWSVGNGGAVTEDLHFLGRSRDGTAEYLDELAAEFPDKISIYRKPAGLHWDGKLEMVGAPLASIRRECLLWEIDADELWTVEKLTTARNLFLQDHSLTAALYWCHFFVGRELAVSTRNCYSQNPGMEWLRTWRYYPSCHWVAHEPPRLAALQPDGGWADQSAINPLRHAETEAAGLVFHHYAYATESQLQFKEVYYGYRNAVESWKRLQANDDFPCALKDYFPWVHDETKVDKLDRLSIAPLPGTDWLFEATRATGQSTVDIVVDAVFFQYYNTGIARVWRSLLSEWAATDFGKRLLVLDRAGKAPRIPGLRYLDFPAHDYGNTSSDRELIQKVCDHKNAQLFISSYYTTARTTPSALLVHDMIPELLNADLNHAMWAEKLRAIKQASLYICVSQNTANDLARFHPGIPPEKITVSHNGVGFHQPSPERISAFRGRHGIEKPYFLISGGRSSYKNIIQFFKAFAQFHDERSAYAIVCTGPGESLQPEFAELAGNASLHLLDLPDEELECAYAGAIALVYPSLYEGFGMPIIEAMACGCPVITSPNGPLPEVAGEAALYVASHDADETYRALRLIQQPEIRNAFIAKGLNRTGMFSWQKMANEMATVLTGLLKTS